MLKKIEAIIQPVKTDELRKALVAKGIEGATITQVHGFARQRGSKDGTAVPAEDATLLEKTKIEIVVADDQVEGILSTIQEIARTGHIGDGKIFISPVEEAVRIRTAERGPRAVR